MTVLNGLNFGVAENKGAVRQSSTNGHNNEVCILWMIMTGGHSGGGETIENNFLNAHCGAGHPSSPLAHLLPHLSPFYFSLSFIGFTYFLLLSIPSLSTRIVPLHFQAGGRRRRPNLGLVCFLCNLCYLYSLVKMDCGVLFYLV